MYRTTVACGFGIGLAVSAVACGSNSSGSASPSPDSPGPDGGAPIADASTMNPSDAGATDDAASSGCTPADAGSHILTELYSDPNQVMAMRLANGLLYFSDVEGVWSLPLAGGTPTKVAAVAAGAMASGPFAITATHVVWADQSQSAFQPVLHAQPLSGGSVVDLDAPTLTPLFGVETTDTAAYPLVVDGVSVFSLPLDGGAAATVAANTDLSGLLLVGSTLYFSNSFSGQPSDELLSVAAGGGTPKSLADVGIAGGGPMATDGQNLYFSDNLNQQNSLEVWPLSGGPITTLFTSGQDTSVFTSAGGRVYFGQSSTCGNAATTYAVWEIGADKSNLHVDISGLDMLTAMASDATNVYVATTKGGFVGTSTLQRFAR
jgi:hypothetical protein